MAAGQAERARVIGQAWAGAPSRPAYFGGSVGGLFVCQVPAEAELREGGRQAAGQPSPAGQCLFAGRQVVIYARPPQAWRAHLRVSKERQDCSLSPAVSRCRLVAPA